MKKIILSISVMAIVAGVFYSCTKEDSMTKVNVKTTVDNPQMSAEDLRVENLIVNFKEKVDFYRANTNIKSGEAKSVDSTVWYLEAAANYTYANAGFNGDDYIVDTASIEVSKTNGQILFSDIQLAFDEISILINEHYNAISDSNKQLIVADISIKEDKSDKVKLKVSTGIGKGAPVPVEYDDWLWGKKLGKCEEPMPNTRDASDIIQHALNIELPHFGETSFEFYYTDVTIISTGSQWSQGPYTFWEHQESDYPYSFEETCLSSDDITYYKEQIGIFGVDNIPEGQEIIRYDVDPWVHGGDPGPYRTIMHYARPQYGEFHLGSPDDID